MISTTSSKPIKTTGPKSEESDSAASTRKDSLASAKQSKGDHLYQKNYVHSNLEPGTENKPWDPRWRIAFRLCRLLGEHDDLNWYRKVVLTHPPEIVLLATLETLFKDRDKPLLSKGAYFTGILKNYVKSPQ